MDNVQIKKILASIMAFYPAYYKGMPEMQLDTLINSWTGVFEDYTYEQANAGLKMFVTSDTKGFPPTPGQIIDCIVKIEQPESKYMSEDAAWGMVYRAICEVGPDPEPMFKKLPPIIQKVLGEPKTLIRMGYDDNFNESVEKSHFIRQYRAMIERERNEAKIPSSVKRAIDTALGKETGIEDKGGQI